MTNKLSPLMAGLCLVLALGCGDKNSRARADESGQQVAQGTKTFLKNAQEAGRDISAAAALTPKIKLAITADKKLNDPKNRIDVDSSDESVRLSGHVASRALKNLAGNIAAKVMKDNKAKQKLNNQLAIKA